MQHASSAIDECGTVEASVASRVLQLLRSCEARVCVECEAASGLCSGETLASVETKHIYYVGRGGRCGVVGRNIGLAAIAATRGRGTIVETARARGTGSRLHDAE